MFKIFKGKKLQLPKRDLDEIKKICKVAFIDDKTFPITEILIKSGWMLTKLKDIESLDQFEIRDAHILFVDIQGVGKKLKLPDEGLGLIIALKYKYPNKKIIAYSAEDQGQVQAFHPGLDIADSRISKNANSYEFQFKIEKYAQEIFSFDECIDRIKQIIQKELGTTFKTEDIIKNLEKINNGGDFSEAKILKIFNLQNAANLASVVQLFLSPN